MNALKLGNIVGRSFLSNEIITGTSKEKKFVDKFPKDLISTGNKNCLSLPVTVFFGGDTQDYPEVMSSHRENGRYLQWNLLNMVSLLSIKFPSTEILVIKPKRMEFKTFACFDNFVEGNNLGAPSFIGMRYAMEHLQKLIQNSLNYQFTNSSKDGCYSSDEPSFDESLDINISEVNLVGFSKGCVVLNQLISEAHTILSDPNNEEYKGLKEFWSKVRSIYWLDGGHSGGKDTWITSKPILKSLASFPDLKIRVHVTPYQVKDFRRPWIGKECRTFVDILRRENADIDFKLHFEDEETVSIETHFKVLEEFVP